MSNLTLSDEELSLLRESLLESIERGEQLAHDLRTARGPHLQLEYARVIQAKTGRRAQLLLRLEGKKAWAARPNQAIN